MAMKKLDHRHASEAMMEAIEAAMWAGHLTNGTTLVDVAEAVRTWCEPEQEMTTPALLLRGYAETADGWLPCPRPLVAPRGQDGR